MPMSWRVPRHYRLLRRWLQERLVANLYDRDPALIYLEQMLCPECLGDKFLLGPNALNTSQTLGCRTCGAAWVVAPMDRQGNKRGPLYWVYRVPGRWRFGQRPRRSPWRALFYGASISAVPLGLKIAHVVSPITYTEINMALACVALLIGVYFHIAYFRALRSLKKNVKYLFVVTIMFMLKMPIDEATVVSICESKPQKRKAA